MKIAIHDTKGSFSERWIAFCDSNNIDYKVVDCFKSDKINQLSDCDSLVWHFSQNNPRAILFAKQLIYSIQVSVKKVFPDFNTVWHFDDKVGQKYLLESIGAPLVTTWIFFDRREAMDWIQTCSFPKVFKLRGGAGSQNVKLVASIKEATRLIRKAFGKGFPAYDPSGSLRERWRKYKLGNTNLTDLIEGLVRFVIPPPYSRIRGKARGYIYFQEFVPDNDHDIRVVVIGDKAFAIKRLVRRGDFRASGSGNILYDKELFDNYTIRSSFELANKLKTQCVAFDYVYQNGKPLVLEISYGFSPEGYDLCPGYWDHDLIWHEGKFDPYGWMIEQVVT